MLYMTDRAEIARISDQDDGRIVVDARVARGGNVQEYRGAELGLPDRDIVRVYRPADEVFDTDSMATFPHKYVTLGHPQGSASFDEHAVGWIGDEVARDGEFIRVPMTVAHRKAIDAVKSGQRELSVGYMSELQFEEGETPTGQRYDAKMTKIVVDHVAIVDRARGGSELRIGDWHSPDTPDHVPTNPFKGGHPMAESTRKVVVDGLTIETTEQGAQALEKLQKQVTDSEKALADAEETHKAAIADKDKEIAKKDGEIDELKKQVMSDEDLDKAVKERADLIGKAKVVADQDYSGKSPAEIRKAAVVAVLGDEAVADKSDAYIEARFDVLAEQSGPDPVRTALGTQDRHTVNDNGQSDYEKRITNAWKGNQKEAS